MIELNQSGLTIERVNGLAPDAASLKAGQALASARKWQLLGCHERVVWGECQGSGSSPYQTEIDLSEPAFKCTCPSRKFPCKHSLGLLILFVNSRSDFKAGAPPDWVNEWVARRDDQASRKKAKAEVQPTREEDEATRARREKTKAKRAGEREARVAAGLAELDLWLRDLVRQGLASVQSRGPKLWNDIAARMIDAQAPGIARRLAEMPEVVASGEGWAGRVLAELGKLYLLLEGFKRIASLPEDAQADIRSAIGWTLKEDELLVQDGLRDDWVVLGQRVYDEERLRVRRTWLCGVASSRSAMVLDFSFQGQNSFASGLMPGTVFDGDMVFYPSADPSRAIVKARHSEPRSFSAPAGYRSVDELFQSYSAALSRRPWIETYAAPLAAVVPVLVQSKFYLRDSDGGLARIRPRFGRRWQMTALSGGHPMFVFGEWDGASLLPLSVVADGIFFQLEGG
ncbi:MAG TPA: SWIM zinc finger family protein [Blastocatellia bacterium]|nr:SWIM zinc finger family protein [Blastocatellia bacterium]